VARRPPSREVNIKEILDDGMRVAVEGMVIDFDPNKGEGKLDDGTSIAMLVLENFLFAEDLKPGSFVRVLGRAYLSSEGRIIRAEVVNRLDVDPSLYREVKELERRVYHESESGV
jgi:hypothetical protein